MSRSEQGKNSEPSGPEVSVELRPTALGNQGRSNAAFQVSRAEGGLENLLSSCLANSVTGAVDSLSHSENVNSVMGTL